MIKIAQTKVCNEPQLDVFICVDPPDMPQRLKIFKNGIKRPNVDKALFYAKASYLRHLNHLDVDAIVPGDPISNWDKLREVGSEAYLLMEAWLHSECGNPNALSAVLLLRSGWNGDISIDYVVSTNHNPTIRYSGRAIVAAALNFATSRLGKTQSVFVETAKESSNWWRYINPKECLGDFLDCGTDFVRYTEVPKAKLAIEGFFAQIGFTIDNGE